MKLCLLRNKIEKSGKTLNHLSKILGITRQGLYQKLEGKTEFKASEIQCIANELNLKFTEIEDIFFTK